MSAEDPLLQAVAQTIDALSFTQTHVIDEDFRAHSQSTVDSVRSLQQEQRSRIEQTYGPRPPTADFIASQLMCVYRGEMSSMSIARDSHDADAAAVFSSMPQSKCHAFKREMKQRIHEWERAFREERGVVVTPHDKAALRPVYELYKLSKNQLRESEARSDVAADSAAMEAVSAVANKGWQSAKTATGTSTAHSATTAAPNAKGGAQTTAFTTQTAANNAMGSVPSAVTSSVSFATAPTSASSSIGVNGVGDTPAHDMTNEALSAEKRYLKRMLHHFESEFERQNGAAPSREDRRALAREYSRYGELKNEIQRRQGSKAGSTAPDEV